MNPDLSILFFFNRTISAEWLDPVMIALTSVKTWLPVYLVVAASLIYFKRWVGVRLVLTTILLAGTADLVTNLAIKPLVARERPCALAPSGEKIVDWVRLPDGPRLGYSFPSSHAVNNFAGVVFFILVFPRKKGLYWLLLPASVVAITRLYLGLHYPSDVLGGVLIGTVFAYCFARSHAWTEHRWFDARRSIGSQ